MALEEILQALAEEGEADCKRALSEGKARAKQIIEEAKEAEANLVKQHLAKAKVDLAIHQSKIINSAHFFVKKEVIKAKEELINQAFEQALKDLENTRKQSDYPAIFKKLATETVASLDGEVNVFVDPQDKNLADKTFDELGVQHKILPNIKTFGGLTVSLANNKVSINNTIESRLAKVRQMYKTEVLSVLFGEDS